MPIADAPTIGRVSSNVASAPEARPDDSPERARSSLRSSFSIPPSRFSSGDAAVLEDHLGGVRGADAELRLLLALLDARRPLPDDERGLPAVAELGVDGGDDDVDVGDAAVGDEDLGPVEHPLVAVALRRRAEALDVGAGLRLGHRVGAELDLVAEAEALRDPLRDLLGRAGRGEAGGREAGAGEREGDARAPPVRLLCVDGAEDCRRDRRRNAGSGSMPCIPCSRAALMTSHGVDSSRSWSAATGRITSAANRWHSSLNSSCSSV